MEGICREAFSLQRLCFDNRYGITKKKLTHIDTKKTFVNGALQNMTEQMNCIEVSIFIRSKFNYILINVHKYRETSSFFVYDFNRKCHNQLFLLNYHI